MPLERLLHPFSKVCSFGQDVSTSDDDSEMYDYSNPRILDSDAERLHSDSLVRQLSSLKAPLVVAGSALEAVVNIGARHGTAAPGTSPLTASFTRLTTSRPPQGAAGIHWTESRKLLEAAIATEQQFPRTDPVDYRHDVVAQEQRLNSRLYSLGLEMCVQKGDGNCQFRSLSWGLYGTPRHHAYVRKTCCDYMGRCRAEFEAFLGEDFRAYVKAMARDGVWGDELTLRAACEALGVVINVVTSDPENWFLRYVPAHSLVKREIFLSYVSPVHYNSIRRRPRGAAPMLRSLSSLGRRDSRILAALDEYERTNAVPENPQALAEAAIR